MNKRKSIISALALTLLASVSASAQQITGTEGSPEATTTIDGKQIPPPDPKFGGEIKEKASVPSKEGLIMGLEASILYHLDPVRAATVYQQMGPTYADILLIPTFRSAIRAITAGNTAASLYSDGREGIAQQILEDVRRQVAPRGVIVENVLLRDLQLPETLKHAIEAKQQAQQEAQRMEYVLQREKQEAERKRVEAAGIKDFQDIVSQGISEKLLEWKGIEATMELVKSPNAKVIIVGNSKNGLPLIYSGDKQ